MANQEPDADADAWSDANADAWSSEVENTLGVPRTPPSDAELPPFIHLASGNPDHLPSSLVPDRPIPPMVGCEWWQAPVTTALAHHRNLCGEQVRPYVTHNLFSGLRPNYFTNKAITYRSNCFFFVLGPS